MFYITVFSPDGEMFEVPRDRADYLLLELGWTQSKPTDAPKADLPSFLTKTHKENKIDRPAADADRTDLPSAN